MAVTVIVSAVNVSDLLKHAVKLNVDRGGKVDRSNGVSSNMTHRREHSRSSGQRTLHHQQLQGFSKLSTCLRDMAVKRTDHRGLDRAEGHDRNGDGNLNELHREIERSVYVSMERGK